MQLKTEESYVKVQIINALLSLMKKYAFDKITITQMVQVAHVGRASFLNGLGVECLRHQIKWKKCFVIMKRQSNLMDDQNPD